MQLTDSEIATVLAALRLWQADVDPDEIPMDFADHFEEHQALDEAEIDALCQKINFAGPPTVVISVEGGVAQLKATSEPIDLLIMDYDCDNMADEETDEDGQNVMTTAEEYRDGPLVSEERAIDLFKRHAGFERPPLGAFDAGE